MGGLVAREHGGPTPITGYKAQGGQTFALSTSSARNPAAFSQGVVTIIATADCFFELGDSTIEATVPASAGASHFLKADTYLDLVLGGATHIAAITASGSGTFYVSEREAP
jgi:C4-dicarboxylate transporter